MTYVLGVVINKQSLVISKFRTCTMNPGGESVRVTLTSWLRLVKVNKRTEKQTNVQAWLQGDIDYVWLSQLEFDV
jgi:hypothetical protein